LPGALRGAPGFGGGARPPPAGDPGRALIGFGGGARAPPLATGERRGAGAALVAAPPDGAGREVGGGGARAMLAEEAATMGADEATGEIDRAGTGGGPRELPLLLLVVFVFVRAGGRGLWELDGPLFIALPVEWA